MRIGVSRGFAALVLLVAGAAVAEERDPRDPARSGAYVGLSGVYAIEDFDQAFDDSAGVNLRFGYRFRPTLAAELTYEWLEGFDSTGPIRGVNDPRLNPSKGDVEIDTHLLTVNTKVFALPGRIQPYALLGMGALVVNLELRDDAFKKPFDVDAGFAMRFGGGVDLYATDSLVVGLEGTYLVPTGAIGGYKFGTLGLTFQYRF